MKTPLDANTRLNLAVVVGVMGVALVMSLGSVALAYSGRAVPDGFGNIILAIVSGLIGFLARDLKQSPHSTVDAPNAGTVNVGTPDPQVPAADDEVKP